MSGFSSVELLQQLRHAVLALDAQGRVQQVNETTAQLFHQEPERLQGLFFPELFPQDPRLVARMQQVLEQGKEFRLSAERLETPPFQGKIAELVLGPLYDADGVQQGALLTLLETTSLAEARHKEQEEQFAHSLGMLVASLAHEVQNPLGGVKGMLQLHERELEAAGLNTDSVEMMLGELGRVERLLRHLLFLSHPMPLSPSSFNIHELLSTIIEFERNINAALAFRTRFDPSLPEITGDRDKLHQVFLNLIRNAAQASPEAGTVTIRTEYCQPWELAGTNLDPTLAYLQVLVEDEGSGVAPEHQDRLFQPLFTTKPEGNGLGLSISQRILQAHSGLLRYRPRPEGGACFQAFLPRNRM